ncbi:hypothetical protein E2320_009268, partial [Naja naja]
DPACGNKIGRTKGFCRQSLSTEQTDSLKKLHGNAGAKLNFLTFFLLCLLVVQLDPACGNKIGRTKGFCRQSLSTEQTDSLKKLHGNAGAKLNFPHFLPPLPPGCPTSEASGSEKTLPTWTDPSAFHRMLMAP